MFGSSPSGLVYFVLLGLIFSIYFPFVGAIGFETATNSLEITETETGSISPPPTPTKSLTKSLTETESILVSETASLALSGSVSATIPQGACEVAYAAVPLSQVDIPFTDVADCPEYLRSQVFSAFEISAVEFAAKGMSITVVVKNAMFNLTANPQDMFRIFAKSRLVYPFFFPVDKVPVTNDYDSVNQNHGFARSVRKKYLVIDAIKKLTIFTLIFRPVPSYRLSKDEWIYISLFENSTIPKGCAVPAPVKFPVLHITSFRRPFFYAFTQGICFVVLVFGVLAACFRSSIPLSHHAGMVAIMGEIHFAQEDGKQMGVGIHPTQMSIGDDKYKYVVGLMIGNFGLVAIVLLTQIAAVVWMKFKKYSFPEAFHAVVFPRIGVALAFHLTASTMFGCGRNFGNIDVLQFIVTTLVLTVVVGIDASALQMFFSSRFRQFQAEFIEGNSVADSDPLDPTEKKEDGSEDKKQGVKNYLTTLRKTGYDAFTHFRGKWEPTDSRKYFVENHGFVFENYHRRAKYWMGIEAVDFFLTTILSVFDNYTSLLAFYQFFVTLCLKVAVIVLMIVLKPMNSRYSGLLLLVVYSCLVIAALSLTVGAIRTRLLDTTALLQSGACFVASAALLLDSGIAIIRPILVFRQKLARDKSWELHDNEENNKYAVSLHEGLLLDAPHTQKKALRRAQIWDEREKERLKKEEKIFVPAPQPEKNVLYTAKKHFCTLDNVEHYIQVEKAAKEAEEEEMKQLSSIVEKDVTPEKSLSPQQSLEVFKAGRQKALDEQADDHLSVGSDLNEDLSVNWNHPNHFPCEAKAEEEDRQSSSGDEESKEDVKATPEVTGVIKRILEQAQQRKDATSKEKYIRAVKRSPWWSDLAEQTKGAKPTKPLSEDDFLVL